MKTKKSCMLCDQPHEAKGFCRHHYWQYKTPKKKNHRGWPKGIRRLNQEICSIEGCNNSVYAKNICRKHYGNKIRCNNPLGMKVNICMATGCTKHISGLFCRFHFKKYGTPINDRKGERNHRWNGGKSYFKNHYDVKKNRLRLIFERGSLCQKCGIEVNKKHIQQHHIDGNINNHSDNNILLMCRTCHSRIPKNTKLYGDKTLKQWSRYFKINHLKFVQLIWRMQKKSNVSKASAIAFLLIVYNKTQRLLQEKLG